MEGNNADVLVPCPPSGLRKYSRCIATTAVTAFCPLGVVDVAWPSLLSPDFADLPFSSDKLDPSPRGPHFTAFIKGARTRHPVCVSGSQNGAQLALRVQELLDHQGERRVRSTSARYGVVCVSAGALAGADTGGHTCALFLFIRWYVRTHAHTHVLQLAKRA